MARVDSRTIKKPTLPKAKKPAPKNVKKPTPRAKESPAAKKPLPTSVKRPALALAPPAPPPPKRTRKNSREPNSPCRVQTSVLAATPSVDPTGWRAISAQTQEESYAGFKNPDIDAAEMQAIIARLETQLDEMSKPIDEEGRWEGYEGDTGSEQDGEWEKDTPFFEVVVFRKRKSELGEYKKLEADEETGEMFRGSEPGVGSVFSVVVYKGRAVRRSPRDHSGSRSITGSVLGGNNGAVLQRKCKGKGKGRG